MKRGHLSQYFKGIAAKHLSAVEADAVRSNQHELNGDRNLRQLLGECGDGVTFSAKFIYLNDHAPEPVIDSGYLTWYDARQKARLSGASTAVSVDCTSLTPPYRPALLLATS